MPSAFDNLFQSAAFGHHKEHFGEPIVYFLRAGGRRSITAIINRDPPAFYGSGDGEVITPSFTIRIDNDCQTGVLASEIDILDHVELLAELGDTKPTKVTVLKLMSQDSGVCVVALK